jgi:hypothetical protein
MSMERARETRPPAISRVGAGPFVIYHRPMHQLARWWMAALVLLPVVWMVWSLTASVRRIVSPAAQIGLAAIVLYLLHRALGAAEDRGWIYYRKKRGSYGGLGVTSEWLNMYDPSRKHVQQALRMREWQRDEDDDGDRPHGDEPSNR